MPQRILLHNTTLMPPRLILAFALSLAIHAGLLLPDLLKRLPAAPPPPALQATLRLPPEPETTIPFQPLLKNTLDDDEPQNVDVSTQESSTKQASNQAKKKTKSEIEVAEKVLSKYVFYPEAARSQGIQGTVGLVVMLSEKGSIEDVQVVSSSGYSILDSAAEKGAWAIQKLPPGKSRVLPLNYTFRLVR